MSAPVPCPVPSLLAPAPVGPDSKAARKAVEKAVDFARGWRLPLGPATIGWLVTRMRSPWPRWAKVMFALYVATAFAVGLLVIDPGQRPVGFLIFFMVFAALGIVPVAAIEVALIGRRDHALAADLAVRVTGPRPLTVRGVVGGWGITLIVSAYLVALTGCAVVRVFGSAQGRLPGAVMTATVLILLGAHATLLRVIAGRPAVADCDEAHLGDLALRRERAQRLCTWPMFATILPILLDTEAELEIPRRAHYTLAGCVLLGLILTSVARAAIQRLGYGAGMEPAAPRLPLPDHWAR